MDVEEDEDLTQEQRSTGKTVIINEQVKINEYAGGVFRKLRLADGISQEEVIKSLNPEANQKAIASAGESQGKSGSFFFFSHDSKFIIKTMTEGELETFKGMFEDYHNYLTEENRNSMLARIYGIFTVYLEDIVPIHLILMKNTLQWVSGTKDTVESIFDLKGSLHNRVTNNKGIKNTSVLKDQNIQLKRT